MSNAPTSGRPPDAGDTAHQFFAVQELLSTPELARFYTDLLLHSPTAIPATRKRQDLSKSTAYKYANTLAELGVVEERNEYDEGSARWRADPVSGDWTGEMTLEIGPTIIAVYGAVSVDEDLKLFVDRHGQASLASAVMATLEYLHGETTRRGVADDLGIPAVEAIAVTQAIERIVAVVQQCDPTLSDMAFDVDVHERAIAQGPYQLIDE